MENPRSLAFFLAVGRAGRRERMTGKRGARSALILSHFFSAVGTADSVKMASTGHCGTQAPQQMQVCGLM